MSKWFCINCKKAVDTYMDIFKGFSLCCKECGTTRLMKMDEMEPKEFEKFAEEFKKRTGEVE